MVWGRIFRTKPFLTEEDEAWHLDVWRWLLLHHGGVADLKLSPVVTPTRAFFPPTETTGHARAEHIFQTVKSLARIPDWPCELVAQPERPETKVGDFAILKIDKNATPLGTFRVEGDNAVISYDPKSVGNPIELVSTLAHELAHYRLATIAEEQPGGHEMHEYATDLMTIYMGFGLFGANRAFNFSQHHDFQSQGWQWSKQGYLSERDWIFSLAVFAILSERPITEMREFLKPHLYSDLRKAEGYLKSNADLLPV